MINKLTTITYTVVCLFLLLQVGLSSWRATDGDRLSSIQEEIAAIQLENAQIESSIFELTSLDNISRFALEKSMKPALVTNLSTITVALNWQ
jgi:hypothetical protein